MIRFAYPLFIFSFQQFFSPNKLFKKMLAILKSMFSFSAVGPISASDDPAPPQEEEEVPVTVARMLPRGRDIAAYLSPSNELYEIKQLSMGHFLDQILIDMSRSSDAMSGKTRFEAPIVLYRTSKADHFKMIYKSPVSGQRYCVYGANLVRFLTHYLAADHSEAFPLFQNKTLFFDFVGVMVRRNRLVSAKIQLSPPHFKTKQKVSGIKKKSTSRSLSLDTSPEKERDDSPSIARIKDRIQLLYISCRPHAAQE